MLPLSPRLEIMFGKELKVKEQKVRYRKRPGGEGRGWTEVGTD